MANKSHNAGTINPHLPKRTVASTQLLDWLEELDEDDLGRDQ